MTFLVTLDLDWCSEPAVEETLDFLQNLNITPTVFITHRSRRVEKDMDLLDVGLHPYFGADSSHGATNEEIARYVTSLPHNVSAFRCHRFAHSNESTEWMQKLGMTISSNVCTDLECLAPFYNRFGMLEIPIFLEDGGYLMRGHPLEIHPKLQQAVDNPNPKVVLIHPMHFMINTPNFQYMREIKNSVNRQEWNTLSKEKMATLRWKGRGIRDLIIDLLTDAKTTTLHEIVSHNHHEVLL